ncbi:MAG TPA: hypothetical protein PK453_14435 [Leptospiraceae bacterium]|nr:hypothetical protein [Leptospiraceae bacterium]HNF14863.1 hypothetical protein [Leptospiraceae bacterium]HNF24817.1 hypothetical protein [Leptospiraceae bacterium]HNH11213.1 hypothetical protein [Leptospiraceae bacterium]HNI26452.1 hypothetical protein [Leptospiraceae bacterium]
MKYTFTIIIALTAIFFSDCTNRKPNPNTGLKTLVLNNFLNGTASDKNKSEVILTRIDTVSYTGQCFDTFTVNGITVSPSNYYNTFPGGSGGAFNSNLKRWALSTSDCTALGFTGGTNTNFGSSTQRPDPNSGFTFKMYQCDPGNNPCSKSAITAAGF